MTVRRVSEEYTNGREECICAGRCMLGDADDAPFLFWYEGADT